jgi:hypothetical protein
MTKMVGTKRQRAQAGVITCMTYRERVGFLGFVMKRPDCFAKHLIVFNKGKKGVMREKVEEYIVSRQPYWRTLRTSRL